MVKKNGLNDTVVIF